MRKQTPLTPSITLPSAGFFSAVLFAVILFGCSPPTDLTGTSSGVETKVARGLIVAENGNGSAGIEVTLVPSGYNPVSDKPLPQNLRTMTDTKGRYTFYDIDTGTYNVLSLKDSTGTTALQCAVHLAMDSVDILTDTLWEPGVINVGLPGNIDALHGYVYIPGSKTFSYLNGDTGSIVLAAVPAEAIASVCYSATNGDVPKIIRHNVQVISGDTVTIAQPDWAYSRGICLNTSASGANVAGNVYNFPVLIRLASDAFTFSQAKNNGADIRFTKHDFTPLPYEIERWDAAKGQAEIWVKVDTVFGNNAAQSIMMYWGNPNAADNSNGTAVFDTAEGFSGVWHLSETGESIHDATDDAFNGKNSGSTAATGIIGDSRNFKNGNYIKISGLLKSPASVTLSAWVRYDTSSGGEDIVSIGDAVLIRVDDVMNGIGTTGSYHNNSIVSDSNYANVSSKQYLAKTGWHYLAFSINSATQTQAFYIDGVQCAVLYDVHPIYYAGLGADTYIGVHGNGKKIFNFVGQVDEVRVNRISVTSDWIKLCFMNQKEIERLIIFK